METKGLSKKIEKNSDFFNHSHNFYLYFRKNNFLFEKKPKFHSIDKKSFQKKLLKSVEPLFQSKRRKFSRTDGHFRRTAPPSTNSLRFAEWKPETQGILFLKTNWFSEIQIFFEKKENSPSNLNYLTNEPSLFTHQNRSSGSFNQYRTDEHRPTNVVSWHPNIVSRNHKTCSARSLREWLAK